MRANILYLMLPILGLTAAEGRQEEINKRAIVYVTRTTTLQMGLDDYNDATTQNNVVTQNTAAAPTSAAAAPTTLVTSRRKSGLLDLLDSLFGDDDDDDDDTVAATTSDVNTQSLVTSSAAATTSDDSGIGIHLSGGFSGGFSATIPSFSSETSSTQSSDDSTSTSTGSNQVEEDAQKAMGISYSPYTKSGSCKSSSQVKSDISLLSAYSIIRLYGTDCSGVENALAAISSSQKLFLGIYNIDSTSISNDLSTIKSAVQSSSRGWDAVHTISIGNELVNAGSASASDISTAVKTARNWLSRNASGYNGYVVSVDTLVATVNNPDLCDVSDYLAVNCHPFWDGGVQPSNAGSWLNEQIENLKSTCNNNKDVIITETGWPTQGDSYGSCVPSKLNQLSAIGSIMSDVSTDVFMFTTYNDYWKDGGQYGVEKYWGIYGDPSS